MLTKPALRAGCKTLLYVAVAGVSLLSSSRIVAIPLFCAAGLLHFAHAYHKLRRERLRKSTLKAILRDWLQRFLSMLAESAPGASFAIWTPYGNRCLVACAADPPAVTQISTNRLEDARSNSAIWRAFASKQIVFERRATVPALRRAETVQVVEDDKWDWRIAHPIFHAAERGRVVGVMTIQGATPEGLELYDIRDSCARAAYVVSPIVTVIEACD